jgi:hypothetical protein
MNEREFFVSGQSWVVGCLSASHKLLKTDLNNWRLTTDHWRSPRITPRYPAAVLFSVCAHLLSVSLCCV